MSDTRSIAALAAKRRHRVQKNNLASESQPSLSDAGQSRTFLTEQASTEYSHLTYSEPEDYLSESRLAFHDNKFGHASHQVGDAHYMEHPTKMAESPRRQKHRQGKSLYRNMVDNRASELRQSKQAAEGAETQKQKKAKKGAASYQQVGILLMNR